MGHVIRIRDFDAFHGLSRKVFLYLAHNPCRTVYSSEIIDHVYADCEDGGPDDARGTIRQTIFRNRHKLPEDWNLFSKNHGHYGYLFAPSDWETPRSQRGAA